MNTILDIVRRWRIDDDPHPWAAGGEPESPEKCIEFEMMHWNGKIRHVPGEASVFSRIDRTGIDPAKAEFLSTDEIKRILDPKRGQLHFYRGQNFPYQNCYSTLFRTQPTDEWGFKALLTLQRFRVAELELLMRVHPFTSVAQKHGFDRVDFLGLAQHYGIPTALLDVTSDLKVAAFFAVAVWDKQSGKHVPASEGEGVMFRLNPMRDHAPGLSYFDPVGFGPGLRPARQHAWTFRMHPQMDFQDVGGLECERFRHDKSASNEVFGWFDNGNYLFPPDCLESVVVKLGALPFVTESAVRHAAIQDGVAADIIEKSIERAAHFLGSMLGIDLLRSHKLAMEEDDLRTGQQQAAELDTAIGKMSKGFRLVRSA